MLKLASGIVLALSAVAAYPASAADRGHRHAAVSVHLSGAQEVPTVITDARGNAVLRIQGNGVAYSIRYRDLRSDIEQAHIHIGAPGTTGGIAVHLCNDLGTAPAGTPPCPPAPGRLTGTIDAGDVVGPAAQGVDPGDIASLIQALRDGLAYLNIHTVTSPAGEIRGDVGRRHGPH
jgi:hypothetical protein